MSIFGIATSTGSTGMSATFQISFVRFGEIRFLKTFSAEIYGVERVVNSLLKICHLRLGRDDVDRGELAFVNQSAIVFELPPRVANRVTLDLQISQGVCQIPISFFDTSRPFRSHADETVFR